MMQENIAILSNVIFLPFQVVNLGDANGNAVTPNVDSAEYPPLPWGGSIIGLSARHNALLGGTSTITWTPTVDGTPVSGLSIVTSNSIQQAVKNIAAGKVNFGAGKRLGLAYTKTGTVTPTTTDVLAGMWVLLNNMYF